MELHFRQNSTFVFGTRLAVFYATLYNATSNCVDFVVELFDCTWYFLFFTFTITKLAYQIDDFLLLWQKWSTTQLSTFDVVFSTSKFMYSQAAQARDVTLAFERLQRCDLQGFVWELYGFALNT